MILQRPSRTATQGCKDILRDFDWSIRQQVSGSLNLNSQPSFSRRYARMLRFIHQIIVYGLVMACSGYCVSSMAADEERLFSGPQVGEKLPEFEVRGVIEPHAGEMLNFVKRAKGEPLVLVFVHDVNRMSIGMTRILTQYTSSREKDGLHTGVVWLHEDPSEAEATIKRVKHALAPKAPVGVSLEGKEGPGSLGLNRKVTLTILVAKEGEVTANYPLVQPSLQVDLPKILKSVCDVAGGPVPKLDELEGMREMRPARPEKGAAETPNLRPYLAPLIRKDASDDDVDRGAKELEELAEKEPLVKKELGRIAKTIVDAGKVENYGTPKTQEYLKKWAEKYGEKKE